MCQWTADSQRLILESFAVIHDSPSHIYHSVLPFCPSPSWLHQCYSEELSQEVKVAKGPLARGEIYSHTVLLGNHPLTLAYWGSIVAVGSMSCNIIVLDAITGSQFTTLSDHADWVKSLTFSPDGALLVSGSYDKTIKLWDMQTGGVVRTLHGHTNYVFSVSISVDCTTIASGSDDKTIRLWDVQTGECHHTIEQQKGVYYVSFFPLNPQHIISISGNKVWLWDIDSNQIAPTYDGSQIAFSLDGTQFALCNGETVEVWSSSGETTAQLHATSSSTRHCCFSPDSRLIAVATGHSAYIWDITSSDPHLIETCIGHTNSITSLVFSSPTSLISASRIDKSVKFWKIATSSPAPASADPKSTGPTSAPIKSITLQAKDGITISSDSDGVVKIWDISTGHCKASFQTPAKGPYQIDTLLTNSRLISVWCTDEKTCIWDTEKGELLRTVDIPGRAIRDLRISADGSKVFCLYTNSIEALSISTGEVVGRVEFLLTLSRDPFMTTDGSKVWVQFPIVGVMGWDFGTSGSPPIKLSNTLQSRSHLDFIDGVRKERSFLPGIKDTVTGKKVLQLPEELARPSDAQWDGQYLVAGYASGEVLILDCDHVLLH